MSYSVDMMMKLRVHLFYDIYFNKFSMRKIKQFLKCCHQQDENVIQVGHPIHTKTTEGINLCLNLLDLYNYYVNM